MATKKQSFAKSFEELEEITQWFEGEESGDLEKGLKKFEKGLLLAKELKEKLAEVENKVLEMKKKHEK